MTDSAAEVDLNVTSFVIFLQTIWKERKHIIKSEVLIDSVVPFSYRFLPGMGSNPEWG